MTEPRVTGPPIYPVDVDQLGTALDAHMQDQYQANENHQCADHCAADILERASKREADAGTSPPDSPTVSDASVTRNTRHGVPGPGGSRVLATAHLPIRMDVYIGIQRAVLKGYPDAAIGEDGRIYDRVPVYTAEASAISAGYPDFGTTDIREHPDVVKWAGLFPAIQWAEPVLVSIDATSEALMGHGPILEASRWCCRVCIAERGLYAPTLASTPFCFDRLTQAKAHVARVHGILPDRRTDG